MITSTLKTTISPVRMGSLLMRKNRISPCKADNGSFRNRNVKDDGTLQDAKMNSEVKLKTTIHVMDRYRLSNRELKGKKIGMGAAKILMVQDKAIMQSSIICKTLQLL